VTNSGKPGKLGEYNPYPVFPCLCYNRAAVRNSGEWRVTSGGQEARHRGLAQGGNQKAESQGLAVKGELQNASALQNEDSSRYCPVCSQRLESRRCKLICSVCGYYMSCADYY